MGKRLTWGPEANWQHPELQHAGSLSLHVRYMGSLLTGLRCRAWGAWRSVEMWGVGVPPAVSPGTLIYLSGPMTGHPDNNVPLFERYAQLLREQGFRVMSPPELARQLGVTPESPDANDQYEQMLAYDLQAVDRAQMVLLLGEQPWTSRGVRLELRRAYMRKCPVMHFL